MSLEYSSYHGSNQKRQLDIVLSSLLTVALSPAECFAKFYLSKILDAGSVYFEQEREGLTVQKLRTMVNGHDTDGTYSRNNSRIPTRGARLIRETRIDEIPQLQQVRKGEMSLVGYRPLPTPFIEDARDYVTPNDFELWRLSRGASVKAGITGPAQLSTLGNSGHNSDYYQSVVESDIKYATEATLGTDIELLTKTIKGLSLHLALHVSKPQ